MDSAFWDSSSLVRLCVRQSGSAEAEALNARYGMTVWWGSPVEIQSAIARLLRIGQITPNGRVQGQVALDRLRRGWKEIQPTHAVREKAETFTGRFPLTTGDALQLSAAWVWASGKPRNRPFISADARLLDAARELGFNAMEA